MLWELGETLDLRMILQLGDEGVEKNEVEYRRKENMSQKRNMFMFLSRLCAFEDFALRLMLFAYILFSWP